MRGQQVVACAVGCFILLACLKIIILNNLIVEEEKQKPRIWLKLFRAIFGAVSVSFIGDIVIVIFSGLISEIRRDIGDFLAMFLISIFIALIFAGIPTLVIYFIVEFFSKKYRSVCIGIYATLLGLYLEVVFYYDFRIMGVWILGAIIAVFMTEYLLRESNLTRHCEKDTSF